jgi:DNA-binding LacI/PurR family transcriptional regulator
MTGGTVGGAPENVKQPPEGAGARPAGAPTIHDVARAAGVSKSLVSRVMSGRGVVSEASRQAVLEAVEAVGYHPNAVARSLVRRRTHTLGVLVSDLHNSFFAEVLDGIGATARTAAHQVVVVSGDRDPEREEELIRTLVELRVDGIVLASPQLCDGVIEGVARSIPVAVVARAVAAPGVDSVLNDDHRGAGLAVAHLVGLGHRRIAMLGGGDRAGATARRRGYEQAMERAGLADRVLVVEAGYAEDEGYRAARRLLARPGTPVTAIFAANDLSATGALNALDEAGFAVPGDVSLVGFDNTSIAALRHVALTTVHQDRHELGRRAAELVLDRYADRRRPPRTVVLQPSLVARRTSGPAPDQSER